MKIQTNLPVDSIFVSAPTLMCSVIAPAYNEENTLKELVERVEVVLRSEFGADQFEVIIVNDGSSDQSWSNICDSARTRPYLTGINLRKRSGKSIALMAGFLRARGRYVIAMDADLQNLPEEIPLLRAKLEEGHDVVIGSCRTRHASKIRKFGSWLFNLAIRSFSGSNVRDINSGFKIYRAEVIRQLTIFGQLHRLIPLQADSLGFDVAEQPVTVVPRKFGTSKYRSFRYESAFDLMSTVILGKYWLTPSHFFGAGGLLLLAVSGAALAATVFIHLYGFVNVDPVMVAASIVVSGLIGTVGAISWMLGIFGDFVVRHIVPGNIDKIVDSLTLEVLSIRHQEPDLADAGSRHRT